MPRDLDNYGILKLFENYALEDDFLDDNDRDFILESNDCIQMMEKIQTAK